MLSDREIKEYYEDRRKDVDQEILRHKTMLKKLLEQTSLKKQIKSKTKNTNKGGEEHPDKKDIKKDLLSAHTPRHEQQT